MDPPNHQSNSKLLLLGYSSLLCDTVEDDITDLFRRRLPNSATSKDAIQDIDGFVEEFETIAGNRLQGEGFSQTTLSFGERTGGIEVDLLA